MSRGKAIKASEIARCIDAGMTLMETSSELSTTYWTIWRRARALGVKFSRRGRVPHPGMTAVLRAIRRGARTSPEIALIVSKSRPLVTTTLSYMEDRGLVRRKSTATGRGGRPPIIWYITEAAQ